MIPIAFLFCKFVSILILRGLEKSNWENLNEDKLIPSLGNFSIIQKWIIAWPRILCFNKSAKTWWIFYRRICRSVWKTNHLSSLASSGPTWIAKIWPHRLQKFPINFWISLSTRCTVDDCRWSSCFKNYRLTLQQSQDEELWSGIILSNHFCHKLTTSRILF